jgi:hypothetical protein
MLVFSPPILWCSCFDPASLDRLGPAVLCRQISRFKKSYLGGLITGPGPALQLEGVWVRVRACAQPLANWRSRQFVIIILRRNGLESNICVAHHGGEAGMTAAMCQTRASPLMPTLAEASGPATRVLSHALRGADRGSRTHTARRPHRVREPEGDGSVALTPLWE